MSIGIRSGRIWGISKRLLITALGDYYSEYNPTIYFNTYGRNSNIMIDKVLMNKKLDEFGIPHPKTYYYPFDNLPYTEEECVIKHRFGSRGNHLIFTTFNKIKNYDLNDKYIQKYIPFEEEYRVGIFNQKVLGIREKIPNVDCRCSKIKNSKNCYYETRDIPNLRGFALYVSAKFDVEFTGIDIGVWNGKFIVIELNSSPSIGEYWARLITKDLLDKLYRRE